jgi:tryptophan-rich sensory protein
MEAWLVILIFVAVCTAVNIIMYAIGYYGHGKRGMYARNKYLPPGGLIGLVWIGIFASLGYSFFLAYSGDPYPGKTEPAKWTAATIAIVVVCSYCLLYPFLTKFMHERYIVLLNLIALLMAAALSIIVVNECVAAFWYTLPLLVWCSYVVFSDIMQYNSVIEKYGLNKSKSK